MEEEEHIGCCVKCMNRYKCIWLIMEIVRQMRYMHEKIGKREYVNDTCACVVVIEMIYGICLVNGNCVYYMVYVYVI